MVERNVWKSVEHNPTGEKSVTIKVRVVFRKGSGRVILNEPALVAGLEQLMQKIHQKGGILASAGGGGDGRRRIRIRIELKHGEMVMGKSKAARAAFVQEMQHTHVMVGMHGAAFSNMM